MGKTAIILVGNPTHYINALDFATQYQGEIDSFELLIISEFAEGIAKMEREMSTSIWTNKRVFSGYKMAALQGRIRTFSILKSEILKKKFDFYVISNFSEPLHYVLCLKLRDLGRDIIALDDGTPTLKDLWTRQLKKDFENFNKLIFRRSFEVKLATGVYLPSRGTLDSLTFFSLFEVTPGPNDTLVKNKMRYSRSDVLPLIEFNSVVYFLGSQMVDKGLVSMHTYISGLKQAKDYFDSQNLEVKYIKHRAASKKIVNEVEKVLKVKTYSRPIEQVIARCEIRPAIISGFFSSAFFNLSALLENQKLTAFRFRSEDIIGNNSESKEYIEMVYNSMELHSGIQLIDLI